MEATEDLATVDTEVRVEDTPTGMIIIPGATPVAIPEPKTTQNPIPTGMTTSGLETEV